MDTLKDPRRSGVPIFSHWIHISPLLIPTFCIYLAVCFLYVPEHQVLDWSREALSKMRVLELKRMLASWGEECRACLEKTELIDLIQEVAPKHSTAQPGTHSSEL